jgi:hypothetical protein
MGQVLCVGLQPKIEHRLPMAPASPAIDHADPFCIRRLARQFSFAC